MSKKITIETLRKFPEYANASERCLAPVVHKPKSVQIDKSQDEITSLLFAPDPVTGNPRSDIAIMMSGSSSPEVREYIQKVLMSGQRSSEFGTDDADLALQSIPNRGEQLIAYAERLRELTKPKDK